jgi:hypothetical protein
VAGARTDPDSGPAEQHLAEHQPGPHGAGDPHRRLGVLVLLHGDDLVEERVEVGRGDRGHAQRGEHRQVAAGGGPRPSVGQVQIVRPWLPFIRGQVRLIAEQQHVADPAERVGLLQQVAEHPGVAAPASVDGQRRQYLAPPGRGVVQPRPEHVGLRVRAAVIVHGPVEPAQLKRHGIPR